MRAAAGLLLLPFASLAVSLWQWPALWAPAAERLHRYWEANGMTIDPLWLAGETEEMQAMVAQVEALRRDWRGHLEKAHRPAKSSTRGRGLVLVGGWADHAWVDHGVRTDYTLEALLAIASVRLAGCYLPVELWHPRDDRLLQVPAVGLLTEGNATSSIGDVFLRNIHDYPGGTETVAYMLTSFAVKHSRFDEVLYLDADNVAIRNPEAVYESAEYKRTGVLFWPDTTLISSRNPMWGVIASRQPRRQLMRAETGQYVIDRWRHWKAVELYDYFNGNGNNLYWNWSFFDTDLAQYAFSAVGQEFAMVEEQMGMIGSLQGPFFCGHSVLQFHPDHPRRILFLHRTSSKWSLTRGMELPTSALKRGFLPTGLDIPWPYPRLHDPSWFSACGQPEFKERSFFCGFCRGHGGGGPHCGDLVTDIDDSADAREEVERVRSVESRLLELRDLISNETSLLPSWRQRWLAFVTEHRGIFAL